MLKFKLKFDYRNKIKKYKLIYNKRTVTQIIHSNHYTVCSTILSMCYVL